MIAPNDDVIGEGAAVQVQHPADLPTLAPRVHLLWSPAAGSDDPPDASDLLDSGVAGGYCAIADDVRSACATVQTGSDAARARRMYSSRLS